METNDQPDHHDNNDEDESNVISLQQLVGAPQFDRAHYVIAYLLWIVFSVAVIPFPWNTFSILGGLVVMTSTAWPRANKLIAAMDHVEQRAATGTLSIDVSIARQGFMKFSQPTSGTLVIRSGVMELISPQRTEWWRANDVSLQRPPGEFSQGGLRFMTPSGRRTISLVPAQDPAEQWRARVDASGHGAIAAVLQQNADPHA